MPKLRVFLVDDHAVVRAGLRALLAIQPGMEVVGEAGDGRQALQRTHSCGADVVVMDISMPGLNGIDVTSQIQHRCPDTRVIALSIHEETSYLRSLLAAGASGYVLKRSAADTLVTAIHTVAGGAIFLDPALSGSIADVFTGRVSSGSSHAALSEREAGVLQLIAQGYSNKEIAERLSLSVKTVETYKARGMQKLNLDSRVAIVRFAARQGWL